MGKLEARVVNKFAGRRLRSALQVKASLSELYHENTKLGPLSSRAYGHWIAQISYSPLIREMIRKAYKVYSLSDQIPLPPLVPSSSIEELLADRRSVRSFTGEAVTVEQLARLLHFTYGITNSQWGYRAIASGGALYPLELYPVALQVEGLEKGIYHYNVEHNCLDVVREGDFLEALQESIYFDTVEAEKASLILVVTAIFRRMTLKYQDRGYRLILMEAGEVGHNISLLAKQMGLGACLIGGFQDDILAATLEIDGLEEAPLLPIAVGAASKEAPGPPEGDGEGTW